MATPTTPILANRYQLGSIVYSDSTIVAYQAHDQMLNRPVTVELLRADKGNDPTYVQRMLDKAYQAAQANLPHVAALYDQGSIEQRPFLVLEALAGPPLEDLAPLPAERAITLVEQIAQTLEASLASQQSPPEINGQTVRIHPEGRVQLIDLGLEQTLPTQRDAVKTLGRLLKIALTGSPALSGITPLCTLADRAVDGTYQSVDDFLIELQALQQRADTPTTMIPRMHPTIPMPNPASVPPVDAISPNAPIAPPLAAETQLAPQPRRYLWGIAAAGLVLVLLGGSWAILGREITLSPSPSAVAGASPAASASAAPTVTGEVFVVTTRDRQSLVVRTGPGRAFPRVASLPYGTQVEVIGGPQAADGFNWVQIRTDKVNGWCIREALRKP